ncbi:MAG: hypothetical protein ACK5MW_10605 [Enterococcus sp.]
MKTSTKVSIGLSVAAVAGITTLAIVSDSLVSKMKYSNERRKIKRFVEEKFDGNEKLLDVIDSLTNQDLDSLMHLMDKIKDGKKQISVYGNSVKDSTDDLKKKLFGFLDSVF